MSGKAGRPARTPAKPVPPAQRAGQQRVVRQRTAQPQPTAQPRGEAKRSAKAARTRAGEAAAPRYASTINLRSIDGHLTRTATQVMAWYRLAPQAWSFRSDAQRELLINQIAAQLGELQGHWLHLRVTTRPYPVHMWAEAFDHNALGRPPDVAGALGWDGFLEGEQRYLMGLSMSDKEVFLGVEVSGRGTLDRWVERAAPVLDRMVPGAVRAELAALASEVRYIDDLVAGTGLDAVPATGDDVAWLMHRSCSLGLPAPRTLSAAPGGPNARWDTEDLAAFTEGVELYQEPYAPTVKVVGRLRSQTVTRHVAVLSVGLMDGLRIPEMDDPWMQRSDRLPFPVEWSARMYIRRPEEVTGELQRQMGKVRSQIRHYTHDHDLDPPMSLARQADRVLEIEDELSSGLTNINTRLYGWWRVAVAGRDEAEAVSRAQQLLEIYRPKVSIEHPEAQYRYAREFIPGEPLASSAYCRRGSVAWAAAGVPAATAAVGDRRGIMLGETCTATRRPVAWDPWLAQEVRRASGLTAVVGGLGSGKALALDTPLPTPSGWTTMRQVRVGDELLDRSGRPTRVVAATEVLHGRPCYDVSFSDGSVIRADAGHEWVTVRTRARELVTSGAGVPDPAHSEPFGAGPGTSLVCTTEELARALRDGRAGELALPPTGLGPADRFVVGVRPTDSVPVRCVQVDHPEHLYLAGETCIPTHNSFLTGLVVYKTLRGGARWTVLDPSGPLARLAELPELAPFSRHINLLRADPGILNPYRVVAEPKLEHFWDDTADGSGGGAEAEKAWRRERSLAAATRRRLVLDVLTGLLPFDVARLPHTRIVLLRAVREVGGAPESDPAEVIGVLRRHAAGGEEHAGVVADFLSERRELPQAALLFPDQTRDDPWHADRDYRLTVLTMQGMTLPRPGSPREEWTDGESLAVELLNLASWLTQRTIYDADRNLRKGVALDESHFLSQVPTGKVLIDRLARDSRKFNVRALFASQLAGDLLRVSGFASLVNAVFVGRTDDEQAQVEALRLLRVPTGVGYEQMLGTLSPRPRHDDRPDDTPRQFVFADGHGGVEKIRIDMEAPHLAHLADTLDTNPDAALVAGNMREPTPPSPMAGAAVGPRPGGAERALPGNGRAAVSGLVNGARSLESGRPVRVATGPMKDGPLDDEEIDLLDDLDELDPVGDGR